MSIIMEKLNLVFTTTNILLVHVTRNHSLDLVSTIGILKLCLGYINFKVGIGATARTHSVKSGGRLKPLSLNPSLAVSSYFGQYTFFHVPLIHRLILGNLIVDLYILRGPDKIQ